MKTKTAFLLGILTAIAVVSVEAMPLYTTNTLSFSGASWSDGGSLDGYFTIEYSGDTPVAVLSLDVTTGNGTSDGFIGYDYIYNVAGQANTIYAASFDARQIMGAPANELVASSSSPAQNQFYDAPANEPVALGSSDFGSPDSDFRVTFLDARDQQLGEFYLRVNEKGNKMNVIYTSNLLTPDLEIINGERDLSDYERVIKNDLQKIIKAQLLQLED